MQYNKQEHDKAFKGMIKFKLKLKRIENETEMKSNNFPRVITQKYKINHIKNLFRKRVGYELNLENPQTFNEKTQWMKLFYRNPLITKCSDKYAVRRYVEKTVGKKYLIPLAGKGIYNSVEQIDFNELPKQFILKATDGSGRNIICTDKTKLDIEHVKIIMSKWLIRGNSHYYNSFEWGYKNIKPRIICEEFLEQEDGLRDYKFWCFNGHFKYINVVSDYDKGNPKLDFFDRDWNHLNLSRTYPNSNYEISTPKKYEQMIQVAEKLSARFHLVRVDLYEANGEAKFGELTFYPSSGLDKFSPYIWDEKFGELLILPKKSLIFPFEINMRKISILNRFKRLI